MHASHLPCPNVNTVHRSFILSPCGMWSYIFPCDLYLSPCEMWSLHVPRWNEIPTCSQVECNPLMFPGEVWSLHVPRWNVILICSQVECDPLMFPCGMRSYMFPCGMWSLYVLRWNVIPTCSHVECDPYPFPGGMWCSQLECDAHTFPGGTVFTWHRSPGQVWQTPLQMESCLHLAMIIFSSANYFLVGYYALCLSVGCSCPRVCLSFADRKE